MFHNFQNFYHNFVFRAISILPDFPVSFCCFKNVKFYFPAFFLPVEVRKTRQKASVS